MTRMLQRNDTGSFRKTGKCDEETKILLCDTASGLGNLRRGGYFTC